MNKKFLSLIFLLLFSLTACSSNTYIKINQDGSVNYKYSVLLGLERFQSEEARQQVLDLIKSDRQFDGVTQKDIESGGQKGIEYSVDFKNIEEFLKDTRLNSAVLGPNMYLKEGSGEEQSGIIFEKTNGGYKIYGKIAADTIKNFDNDPNQAPDKVTFTLSLPAEPISHNAKIVSEDKKELTWEYTGEDVAVEVEFSMAGNTQSQNAGAQNTIIFIIGLSLAIILIVVIALLIIIKNNKKQK
ncbi:MAG: hypothetical protein GX196_08790 [Clostridiaceae bacterium]|nr:hypothetical protein [Clostridiaceae bacterium]